MADILDDDDIDVETLQAQVDKSMAFTETLVASWMKSSQSKLPSSKTRQKDEERELEEYMRRPPRLGVGAAIPESTSAFGRDTARLKNKLTGGGKKRAREEEKDAVVVLSDDEEESRAGAIKKKVKLDPFAAKVPKKKEKKAKKDAEPQSANAKEHSVTAKVDEGTNVEETASVDDKNNDEEKHSSDSPIPPPSPKKKKKKKKHRHADTSVVDIPASPQATSSKLPPPSIISVESSVSVKEESAVAMTFPRHTKPSSHTADVSVVSAITVFSSPEEPKTKPVPAAKHAQRQAAVAISSAVSVPSSPEERKLDAIDAVSVSSSPIKRVSKPTLAANLPLLNLDGPPTEVEEDPITTPKKKRRRRKKKKKAPVDAHVSDDVENDD